MSTILNSFNAGELTPLLDGRTDIAKYNSGCRELLNFVPRIYGGATRRSGTEYIAEVKDSAAAVRLVAFEFSTAQRYILEFGDQYLRFYRDGAQLTSGGSVYELATPYKTDDLAAVRWVQSADVMYLVHPSYAPRKLSRFADTTWTLTLIPYVDGPFLPQNLETDITVTGSYPAWATATEYLIGDCVTVSGTIYRSKTDHTSGAAHLTPPGNTTDWAVAVNYTGTNVILTASSAIWEPEHVGSLFQIQHIRSDNNISGSYAANTTGSALRVRGNWDFVTHGTWTGTMEIQRSFDSAVTWEPYRSYTSVNDRNVAVSGEEVEDDTLYRINMTGFSSGACRWEFSVQDYRHTGVVQITGRTSGSVVTGTVVRTLNSLAASYLWSEGAWSDYRGWPATIAFFEERLVFAGTDYRPNTIWLSASADYENMGIGVNDDSAMIYTIAAEHVNRIRWMVPQRFLMFGTSDAEYYIGGSSENEPITPTNVICRQQSNNGAAEMHALLANDAILFLQRQGRKIREMIYQYEKDGFVAPDMSQLAEHITLGGITDMSYQRHHSSILWCVRADGKLLGLTYQRDQDVVAWHMHDLSGGAVESVAVVSGTGEDELWLAVRRTIDGDTVRYIERFRPLAIETLADCWYLDSALAYDGGSAKTITGITQAALAVLTITGHGLSVGNKIKVNSVGGMTEINGKIYEVGTVPSVDTITLKDETGTANINSTSWSAYTSGGTASVVAKTFTGLDHLEGEICGVFADNAVHPNVTVAAGAVTLARYVNKALIGLNYTSRLSPMRLEAQMNDGSAQGRTKRVHELTLRLYKSIHAKIGPSLSKLDIVYFRTPDMPMDSAPPLYTGDKRVPFPGGYDTDGFFYIVQDLPLPLTVLAAIVSWRVN